MTVVAFELTLNERKFAMHQLPPHLDVQSAWLLLKRAARRYEIAGVEADLEFAKDAKEFWILVESTIRDCFDGKAPSELGMSRQESFDAFIAIVEYCLLAKSLNLGRSIRPI